MVIVDIHLGRLGIIEGDAKRLLEPYVDGRLFSQRKTYDEYYFDEATVELTIDVIGSLNQLGFKVSINWQEVILS